MKKVLIFIGLITAVLVSLDAKDYSFKVEVSGKGQPMLLIPGLTCAGEVWDETVASLGTDYEYHVVTLPGFAGHPPIATENYLATVGNELITYLKDNELKQAIVVGHSLGGFLSLYIGSRALELVSKLVVVDGLPFLGALRNPAATEESMEEMASMMKKNMELQTAEQYEATQPVMLKSMVNSEEDIEMIMEWGRRSDSRTVAQAMYELYTTDLRQEIANIKAPTLVFGAWIAYQAYGATKESTTQLYQAQFVNLEDYQLKMTDKGKHFIMLDDPEFFISELNDFLKAKS